MKPMTLNVACSWGLPRPIIKSDPEEKLACSWGFQWPVIKSQKNKWAWPWSRGLHKILTFPFNISATAEASGFKFGMRLKFANAHHQITPEGQWTWPRARGAPRNFGVPL